VSHVLDTDAPSDGDSHAASDADPNTGANCDADTGPHGNTNTDPDSDHPDAGTDGDSGADAGARDDWCQSVVGV